MNFRKKETPVDLDQLDRDLANPVERSAFKLGGPEAYAQPHIRNNPEHPANKGWRGNDPTELVSPQTISKAGELMQASYYALAAEVRKAAADEVAHVMELQKRCEEQAQSLEQAGKDLAVVLSATNNTVTDMFAAQKNFAARKRNLEEQLIANGKPKPQYEKPKITEKVADGDDVYSHRERASDLRAKETKTE